MKHRTQILTGFVAISYAALLATTAQAMEISFADAAWDGKTVPTGQQCQKFGGKNPETPKFKISGLPEGTTDIVFEYSDRSYAPMDNGGHGQVGFKLESASSDIEVPSAPGHSFELPAPFYMVKEHQGPGWDKAGAYMPPCSGGRGNDYYVTVKAVAASGDEKKVLAEKVVEMGKF